MSGGFLEALGPLRKMRSHTAIYEVIFWPRSSPVTNEAEVLVGGSTRREKLLVYNIICFLIIRLSKNTWGMKRIFQKLQSETNRDFLACFVWKLRPNEDNHENGLDETKPSYLGCISNWFGALKGAPRATDGWLRVWGYRLGRWKRLRRFRCNFTARWAHTSHIEHGQRQMWLSWLDFWLVRGAKGCPEGHRWLT